MNNANSQTVTLLRWSFRLLGVAIAFLLLFTLVLDSVMGSLPLTTQRISLFVTVVMPAALGALAATLSLFKADRRLSQSLIGLGLNGLVALYFSLVLSFAG